MVLALIFAFLMGAAIIVLVTYLYKNQRLGLPLINKDVIFNLLAPPVPSSICSITINILSLILFKCYDSLEDNFYLLMQRKV